jgi:hypothetical protein
MRAAVAPAANARWELRELPRPEPLPISLADPIMRRIRILGSQQNSPE